MGGQNPERAWWMAARAKAAGTGFRWSNGKSSSRITIRLISLGKDIGRT